MYTLRDMPTGEPDLTACQKMLAEAIVLERAVPILQRAAERDNLRPTTRWCIREAAFQCRTVAAGMREAAELVAAELREDAAKVPGTG